MIKKYNNKRNIAGTFIKEALNENKMKKIELSKRLQLIGVNISSDELLLMEKGKMLIKDFEVVAIAVVLNLDLNNLKKYLDN